MKKNLIAVLMIILVFTFSALSLPFDCGAATADDDTSGFLIEGNTLKKYTGNATTVTIPVYIKYIDDGAFRDCATIVDVLITSNVETIGNNAFFGCTNMKNITFLSDTVLKSVGHMAFAYCGTLREITLPSSITSIGEGAFLACSQLTSFTIPANCASLGSYFLMSCVNITSVTIPQNTRCIGAGSFNNCLKLSSFTVASNNQYYSSVNGVLFSKDGKILIRYPAGKQNYIIYSVPSGTVKIAEMAFWDNRAVTTIIIPQSVTEATGRSFNDLSVNSVLTEIRLPQNSSLITAADIKYCPNLIVTSA